MNPEVVNEKLLFEESVKTRYTKIFPQLNDLEIDYIITDD